MFIGVRNYKENPDTVIHHFDIHSAKKRNQNNTSTIKRKNGFIVANITQPMFSPNSENFNLSCFVRFIITSNNE